MFCKELNVPSNSPLMPSISSSKIPSSFFLSVVLALLFTHASKSSSFGAGTNLS